MNCDGLANESVDFIPKKDQNSIWQPFRNCINKIRHKRLVHIYDTELNDIKHNPIESQYSVENGQQNNQIDSYEQLGIVRPAIAKE